MKKRKSPIILISCLVVFLGSAAIINGFIAESNKPIEERIAEQQAKMKAPTEKVDRQSLVDSVGMSMAEGQEVMANKRKGSSLVKPVSKEYKPVPNPNNVNRIWYKDEAVKLGSTKKKATK